jgi:hypothetical protein
MVPSGLALALPLRASSLDQWRTKVLCRATVRLKALLGSDEGLRATYPGQSNPGLLAVALAVRSWQLYADS